MAQTEAINLYIYDDATGKWVKNFCNGGWQVRRNDNSGWIVMTADNTKVRNSTNTAWLPVTCSG